MSGKAAPNRRVAAIQAKKKRKNPKRKGKIFDKQSIFLRVYGSLFSSLKYSNILNKSFPENSVAGLDSRFYDKNVKFVWFNISIICLL
jgi:hypothetical protein